MPEAFNRCRRSGGKIRTVTLPNRKYRRVCIIGGKRYWGHVKTKKPGSP